MQALPDYMLIDFFDWIRTSKIINIGLVRGCVFMDKYTNTALYDLTPYAEEFINQKGLKVEARNLLESMRAYLTYCDRDKESTELVEEALWSESSNNMNGAHKMINEDEDTLIKMMTAVPVSPHTAMEFLEWLLRQELSAEDVYKMPMCVFEKLVKEFLAENNEVISSDMLTYLRQEIKDKSPNTFLHTLKKYLNLNIFGKDTEKYKTMVDLFGRYSNPGIMKCFFLPLAQDKMFEKFIRESWNDLNSLSRDYLDIFYSDKELATSGYDIKNKLRSLDVGEDVLPCLVLWTNTLNTAKCVELRELEYKEIFHLLQSIVQNIKVGDTFDEVYSKAVEKANDLRKGYSRVIQDLDERSTIMNQTNYNITNSSIVGSQIGTQNSQLNFSQSDFSDEINQAISEIKNITELSAENMKSIIMLLQQIDDAVKEDNKEAQAEAKFTLRGILKGIGNTGTKVVGVLSGLTNLAKFFGYSIV